MDCKFPYIGWTPCISGHLDFGLIRPGIAGTFSSDTKKDKNKICINFASTGFKDNHARYIAMQSWVDWRDELKGDGEFRVCTIAEATESENLNKRCLKGSVVVYPKAYETIKDSYQAPLLDKIHALKQSFVNANNSPDDFWTQNQENLCEEWSSLKKELPSATSARAQDIVLGYHSGPCPEIYRVDFEISPNGLTFLSFHDLNGQEIEINGSIEKLEDSDRFIICRQVFYYLKYSLHVHKHHEQKADALTTIVANDTNSGLKLIGQIKRELLAIKRIQLLHQRFHHSNEAIGIIGYLNSLVLSLKISDYLSESEYESEKLRLNNIEKSFQGQSARFEDKFKKSSYVSTTAKQLTAMILAFISICFLAYINLFRDSLPKPKESELLKLLTQSHIHFISFPIILFVSVFLFYLTFRGYYHLRESSIGFWKRIYKTGVFKLISLSFLPPIALVGVAQLIEKYLS